MGYAFDTTSLPPATTSRRREVQPDTWVMVPVAGDEPALGEVAGFDTLEQAQAVVAGLAGLERARAV